MLNRIFAGALLAFMSFAACAGGAGAATIDTFDFTDSTNWFIINPFGAPTPIGITITGSFTGQVEPNGHIEQIDLSDFAASVGGVLNGVVVSLTSANLQFFSYNPADGPGTLDMIGTLPPIPGVGNPSLCLGVAASLSPSCNSFGLTPVNARGVIVANNGVQGAFTTDLPAITLISSRSVPETSTWAMMLVGFAGLVFAGWRSRQESATAAACPLGAPPRIVIPAS